MLDSSVVFEDCSNFPVPLEYLLIVGDEYSTSIGFQDSIASSSLVLQEIVKMYIAMVTMYVYIIAIVTTYVYI